MPNVRDQVVQTMRGPKAGTGTSSPKRSTLSTAVVAEVADLSERTFWVRILARVIGGPR
jgi:hypothetical protein